MTFNLLFMLLDCNSAFRLLHHVMSQQIPTFILSICGLLNKMYAKLFCRDEKDKTNNEMSLKKKKPLTVKLNRSAPNTRRLLLAHDHDGILVVVCVNYISIHICPPLCREESSKGLYISWSFTSYICSKKSKTSAGKRTKIKQMKTYLQCGRRIVLVWRSAHNLQSFPYMFHFCTQIN